MQGGAAAVLLLFAVNLCVGQAWRAVFCQVLCLIPTYVALDLTSSLSVGFP